MIVVRQIHVTTVTDI